MKPVFQTLFEKGTGNCFSACAASILELDIEDVPNFVIDAKGQTLKMWDAVSTWVNSQGYGMIRIPVKISNTYAFGMDDCWAIGTVPSQAIEGVDHGVIIGWSHDSHWYNPYIAHDPNPNNEPYPILAVQNLELFIKRDKS